MRFPLAFHYRGECRNAIAGLVLEWHINGFIFPSSSAGTLSLRTIVTRNLRVTLTSRKDHSYRASRYPDFYCRADLTMGATAIS